MYLDTSYYFEFADSSSRSNDLLAKLIKNVNILEANNITVPGVASNKISKKKNINILQIVSIGLLNTKISEALIISILLIENLLINRYI